MQHFLKSRAFWLPFAVFMAVALVTWSVVVFRTDRISQTNYKKIRVGMARADVEALLGGPRGNYSFFVFSDQPTGRSRYFSGEYWVCARLFGEDWIGDKGCINVKFDDKDKVEGKEFFPPERCTIRLTPKDQLRYSLHRLQQRMHGSWPAEPY